MRQGASGVAEGRIVDFEAFAAWVSSRPRPAFLGMIGEWARFARAGWASFPCLACRPELRVPRRGRELPPGEPPCPPTGPRRVLGDHVLVRRVGLHKVLLRCWCSAKVKLAPRELVSADQMELVP